MSSLQNKENKSFVSIIVPCYQEREFINQFLESLISQDYPKDRIEVLIIDGFSSDGTRDIILNYINEYNYIRLLDNPLKNQTIGLNIAALASRGEIIIRLDVHANYPVDYVSSLVSAQKRLNAWNVGCQWKTNASAKTAEAFVVANVLSSPFGVGNALYRIGVSKERSVDTVPFGCFPKKVLVQLGYYNEEFIKNEDDELNARIIKAGGSIYLLPYPIITYYSRDTKKKLFSMLFQYGYYKPKVNFSVGSVITTRQLFPPFFVLYCFIIPLIAIIGIYHKWLILFLIPAVIYLILLLTYSFKIAYRLNHIYDKIDILLYSAISFFGMHLSYGFGYLNGLVDLLFRKKARSGKTDEITR
jgi:glycosyltransferase involved in cell wall biosynthesis